MTLGSRLFCFGFLRKRVLDAEQQGGFPPSHAKGSTDDYTALNLDLDLVDNWCMYTSHPRPLKIRSLLFSWPPTAVASGSASPYRGYCCRVSGIEDEPCVTVFPVFQAGLYQVRALAP